MNTLDTVNGSDIDSFLISLNETIQWCSRPDRGNDPAACLRTKDLQPGDLEQFVEAIDRKDLVNKVANNRTARLRTAVGSPAINLAGGRLLAFLPNLTTFEGYTEILTSGFFNSSDTPPYDTWLAYFHETQDVPLYDYLVCWIPSEFIELATIGVKGETLECIQWLDEQPHLLVFQLLKERGFY